MNNEPNNHEKVNVKPENESPLLARSPRRDEGAAPAISLNDIPSKNISKNASAFAEQVGAKAARKLKAQRNAIPGVWFGLGMMGLIGWSVAIPTLLGAALGLWLDERDPGGRSWTLALLVAGLMIGCFNAWLWVAKEDKAMRNEQENNNE
jgi:ATP synthase protein I